MSVQAPDPARAPAAGVGGLLRYNYANFRRTHWAVKLIVVSATAATVFLVWYMIETRGEARGFEAQCKAKCGSLSYRVDRVLLDPFAGEAARRNVREVRCVCGSAP